MLPILMKGPGRMRFRKAVAYVIAVCSLLGIGAIGFLNRTALAKEAHNWHILPQPERLTELYFTEPNQLPNGSSSEQMIAFTVRNLEYQTTTYTYTILAESEDEDEVEHVLGEGAFTLNQNQSGTTSKTVRLPSLSGRAKVRVVLDYEGFNAKGGVLASHRQSIHYWTDAVNTNDDAE